MSMESKKDKNFIRIELTPSQQEQVQQQIGKTGEAIELTSQELEERVAPKVWVDTE